MVCQRCVMTVKDIFQELKIPVEQVTLGEVEVKQELSTDDIRQISAALGKVGFELIESRVSGVIEDVKQRILEYLNTGINSQQVKLSSFITAKIPYEYSYLSDLFSSVEGKTIEQYYILLRLEKVKELIVYNQLSLTEIAYETGFSSVHHLSAQFRKITGLSPSHFRKIAGEKRKSLDNV